MYSQYNIDDPWAHHFNYPEGYHYKSPVKIDVKATINPLLQQVQRLDRIRLTLEKDGGRREEFKELNAALTAKTYLKNCLGSSCISLNQPAEIQEHLRKVGCTNIHFEVRRLKNGLPAYFIGRLLHDYRSSTPLILEELHQSPGFPVTDKRFIRLMRQGHERFYLNLAPYRRRLDLDEKERDELLSRVGRQILIAAWHEDQYPGLMTAKLLGLHSFPIAVELLYLILSADLSTLRHNVDNKMTTFFDQICPQPAIAGFLKYLPLMEGNSLVQLPNMARKHYKSLASGLGELLQTNIRWGSRNTQIELYKILFANFSRPEALDYKLHNHETLNKATQQLEKRANQLIAEMLSFSGVNCGMN